jgi:hypothetical protein
MNDDSVKCRVILCIQREAGDDERDVRFAENGTAGVIVGDCRKRIVDFADKSIECKGKGDVAAAGSGVADDDCVDADVAVCLGHRRVVFLQSVGDAQYVRVGRMVGEDDAGHGE